MRGLLSFVVGALFGAVLGAGTALLLAPKSGDELRKDMRERYDHTVTDIQTRTNDARTKLEVKAAEARKGLQARKARVTEAVQTLRKPENDKVDSVAA